MTEVVYSPTSPFSKKKGEDDLYNLIRKAKCTISSSGRYSGKTWDAFSATVFFQIPLSDYENVNDSVSRSLTKYCDFIMPKDLGYDVLNVEFTPMLEETDGETSLEDDLEEIKSMLQNVQAPFSLPRSLSENSEFAICLNLAHSKIK